MKVAVIFALAVVMMMGQEAQSGWFRRAVRTAGRVARIIVTPTRWGDEVGRIVIGKRDGEAAFAAAFDAATEDNVLTADEISLLVGIDGQELIDFIAEADDNGNGQIEPEEFIAHELLDD